MTPMLGEGGGEDPGIVQVLCCQISKRFPFYICGFPKLPFRCEDCLGMKISGLGRSEEDSSSSSGEQTSSSGTNLRTHGLGWENKPPAPAQGLGWTENKNKI